LNNNEDLVGAVGIEPTTLEGERKKLKAEHGQCPLGPCDIEIVGSQNFKIAEPITQAQFVVGLKFIAVTGPADALKVFPAIWIPCPQLADQSCRDDVVYMTLRSGLLEVRSAEVHFAISTKSRCSMTAPASSVRGRTGPFAIYAFPTDGLLLCPETRLAELTSAVTVCLAGKKLSSEDLSLAIPAVRTTHGHESPFVRNACARNDTSRGGCREMTKKSISIANLSN